MYQVKTCSGKLLAEFDDYSDMLQHIRYFDSGLGMLFVFRNDEQIGYITTARKQFVA